MLHLMRIGAEPYSQLSAESGGVARWGYCQGPGDNGDEPKLLYRTTQKMGKSGMKGKKVREKSRILIV